MAVARQATKEPRIGRRLGFWRIFSHYLPYCAILGRQREKAELPGWETDPVKIIACPPVPRTFFFYLLWICLQRKGTSNPFWRFDKGVFDVLGWCGSSVWFAVATKKGWVWVCVSKHCIWNNDACLDGVKKYANSSMFNCVFDTQDVHCNRISAKLKACQSANLIVLTKTCWRTDNPSVIYVNAFHPPPIEL